jgi:hypothetical protein
MYPGERYESLDRYGFTGKWISAMKQFCGKMADRIRNLAPTETLLIPVKSTFVGSRDRPDEYNVMQSRNTYDIDQFGHRTRIVRGSVGFGHIRAIEGRERSELFERDLISAYEEQLGIKVLTPITKNAEMWDFVTTDPANKTYMDGESWEDYGARLLASPLSSCQVGSPVLLTGATMTTLDNIGTSIAAIKYRIMNDPQMAQITTLAVFGDDMCVDAPVDPIDYFMSKERYPVFLGVHCDAKCTTAEKWTRDNAARSIHGRLDELEGKLLVDKNRQNIHDRRTAWMIQYGFIPQLSITDFFLLSNRHMRFDDYGEFPERLEFIPGNEASSGKLFGEARVYYYRTAANYWSNDGV